MKWLKKPRKILSYSTKSDNTYISVKNTLRPVKGAYSDVNYLRQFRNALKDSKVFKADSRLYTNKTTGNLTGFDIILELQETLRK